MRKSGKTIENLKNILQEFKINKIKSCMYFVHDAEPIHMFSKTAFEQHEEEIRKQERQKVIAELEEWVDDIINILLFGKNLIDYEDIKQKLNEMKEV